MQFNCIEGQTTAGAAIALETNKGVTRKSEPFEQHWMFHRLKFTLTEFLARSFCAHPPFVFGLANTKLITREIHIYFCLNKLCLKQLHVSLWKLDWNGSAII